MGQIVFGCEAESLQLKKGIYNFLRKRPFYRGKDRYLVNSRLMNTIGYEPASNKHFT